MKTCSYCGRENIDLATHCSGCGLTEFASATEKLNDLEKEEELQSENENEDAYPELAPDLAPDEEAALCTFCLFPNRPEAAWCKRCGASTNVSSILGPVDAAWASGHMWRGAVRGRPSRFVFLSVWFIFFPPLVLNMWVLFGTLVLFVMGSGRSPGGIIGVIFFWLSAISTAVSLSMLFQVTRNYLQTRKPML